jgi:hypothetical protein
MAKWKIVRRCQHGNYQIILTTIRGIKQNIADRDEHH